MTRAHAFRARTVSASWVGCVLVLAIATVLLMGVAPHGGWAAPAADDYIDRAIALHRRGRCAEAIVLLQRATALAPRHARAHAWLGFCYAQLGRRQEALAAFQRVVALAPRSEDAHVARRWIARLQAPPRPRPSLPAPVRAEPGVVYLVTLPALAGVTAYNRVDAVVLGGVVYRRALVEYRNWWREQSLSRRQWRVVYRLEGRYVRFRARAGVEDSAPPEFTASFEVRGDGIPLFVGPTKRAGDPPDLIDVDVTAVMDLELLAQASDPRYTRGLAVIWADPHLVAAPARVPTPSVPPPAVGHGPSGSSTR